MNDIRYSIRVAARRSGLSPNLIRVWERRYGTIRPSRGGADGKRRLYTDAEMERLRFLRVLTEAGHAISVIAPLSDDDLRRLMAEDASTPVKPVRPLASGDDPSSLAPQKVTSAAVYLESITSAMERIDVPEMERLLDRSLMDLGQIRTLDLVVVPLMDRIGDRWRQGSIRVSQEHVATAVLRTFLGQLSRNSLASPTAPLMVAATPAGQHHEIGSSLAAAIATQHGWRVVYGGPNLPAEDMASIVQTTGARVLALSLVHPGDDPGIVRELRRIRELLDIGTRMVIGGRVSSAYRVALPQLDAVWMDSLSGLGAYLDQMRARPPQASV